MNPRIPKITIRIPELVVEPKAETVPSYQRKMSSVSLVTFAIEQSPGKKTFFLSERQFFKVRSDGCVAAALDCDKSHQTALTPFHSSSATSPMSPMSKCGCLPCNSKETI